MSRTKERIYRCSNGHEIGSRFKALDACPACIHGKPCDGELKQYAGPRST